MKPSIRILKIKDALEYEDETELLKDHGTTNKSIVAIMLYLDEQHSKDGGK